MNARHTINCCLAFGGPMILMALVLAVATQDATRALNWSVAAYLVLALSVVATGVFDWICENWREVVTYAVGWVVLIVLAVVFVGYQVVKLAGKVR